MPRLKKVQTNFTGGQVDRGLFGRSDLRAYANGAARLENIFVRPLGGARRRDGLRYIDELPGKSKIVAFEFNTQQTYAVVFSDFNMRIYRNDSALANFVSPWPASALSQIAWTQSADTLLVVHPEYPPKRITRTSDTEWTITDWSYDALDDDQTKRIYQPHANYTIDEIKLNPAATTGTGVGLTADADVFVDDHVGLRFRIKDKEVEIAAVTDGQTATIDIIETLPNANATLDWTEQAFSAVRGYPVTVTFHQDRLVIGGSRDAPNTLWISQTSSYFNHDQDEGLDDEAIEVDVTSDQVNAIRGVFSGRDLQVFTTGAEWRVAGDPITPGEIFLKRQTRLGSRADRMIPPLDIDGATIFMPRRDQRPREFLYSDVEQAYSVTDLATVSGEILNAPVQMAYDQDDRLMHVVNGDGTLATLTIFRNEEVAAWSKQVTAGEFLDVETVDGETYFVVLRDDVYSLEKLDPTIETDAAVSVALDPDIDDPRSVWDGLDHLEGETIAIVADGYAHRRLVVVSGQVTLDFEASTVEFGLPFTHYIHPLPVGATSADDANVGLRLRPVAFRARYLDTASIVIDLGSGLVEIPLRRFGDGDVLDQPVPVFTGEKTFRQKGWRNSDVDPLWKIEQDTPFNFELIQVISEINLND